MLPPLNICPSLTSDGDRGKKLMKVKVLQHVGYNPVLIIIENDFLMNKVQQNVDNFVYSCCFFRLTLDTLIYKTRI